MSEQHDSLAQIPINSVLVGLFAESLNTMATPGAQYPEFITIQGSPAANTSSRSYKFKTAEVRQYLGNLYQVIQTMLDNFVPDIGGKGNRSLNMELEKRFEAGPEMVKPESMREAEQPVEASASESQMEETPEPESQIEDTQDMKSQESQPESTEEENQDEAVTELMDEPSTANESEGSPGKGKSQKNKIMSGGRRLKRKLSLKKRK